MEKKVAKRKKKQKNKKQNKKQKQKNRGKEAWESELRKKSGKEGKQADTDIDSAIPRHIAPAWRYFGAFVWGLWGTTLLALAGLLDASSHLYKKVCPSVGPSFR